MVKTYGDPLARNTSPSFTAEPRYSQPLLTPVSAAEISRKVTSCEKVRLIVPLPLALV